MMLEEKPLPQADKHHSPPPPPKSHELDFLMKEVMNLKEKVGKLEGMVEVLMKMLRTV